MYTWGCALNGGAAFVYAPGSMAAARAGAEAVPADVADTITAAGCRSVLPQLIRDGPHGEALVATKAVAKEVTFDTGDLLVLDPFCTHAASTFREEVANRTGLPGRYVLFSDVRSPVRLLDIRHLLPSNEDKDRVIRGSFSIDPQVEVQTDHLSSAVFSPDGELVLAVGGGRAWIWPTDIGAAAEEICPVGIDFFNGFPSLGLTDDAVK